MLAMGAYGYLADYVLWVVLYASLCVHAYCFLRYFQSPRRPWLKLVLGNALVFLVLVASLALAAESYLRFISVATDSFGMTLPARRWFALHTQLNSHGFRDEEWSPDKPAGVGRIGVLGDSFVYGWGVEDEDDRFTERLQARFDARVPGRVQVLNLAKPGWDTGDELQALGWLIDHYAIDEVLLGYVVNDVERILPVTPDFNPTRPPICQWFNTDSSCLFEYVYYRVLVTRMPTVQNYHSWLLKGYTDPDLWRLQQARLAAMARICHERGVGLRAVLLPMLQPGRERFPSEMVHAKVGQCFADLGVPVLDLLPALADQDVGRLIVNRSDAHPNARAQALYAERIWEAFYAQPTAAEASPPLPAPEPRPQPAAPTTPGG